MGGYSHLSPSGHFPRSILVSFVCTCIMLCLCRALLPRRLRHLHCTCLVRGAGGPETSRDHLLDRTIKSARKILRAQSVSVQIVSAREFCRGESFSSEQCSSTLVFEQSSRLLSSRSRDDLSSKGRPTELRAVCCVHVVRWST